MLYAGMDVHIYKRGRDCKEGKIEQMEERNDSILSWVKKYKKQ